MSLAAQLDEAKTQAMREKVHAATTAEADQITARLTVLRMLIGAISEAETAGRTRQQLTDEQIVSLLKKEAAKRRSTAEVYERAGRAAQARQESWEADYIGTYLPQEADLAAVETFVTQYVSQHDLPAGGKTIGIVLGALKQKFGSFDTRAASEIIRRHV